MKFLGCWKRMGSEEEHGLRIHTSGKQISAAQIADRLQRINRDQVRDLLQRIQNGPEIRNLKNYLLTALYQAGLTSRLNQQRKEHGYAPPTCRNTFSNFHQREYDYGKLEQAFLKNAADEQQ